MITKINTMKEITKWYADKIGKTPDEFDEIDKHIETVIQTWEKERDQALTIHSISRSFLSSMAEKHQVEANKLMIGMHYEDLVVQVYDEGSYPMWQTLETITF